MLSVPLRRNNWWRSVERIVPHEVIEVIRILADHGFTCYLVGGAPRDLLLGKIPTDWDLSTDAQPEKVEEALTKSGGEDSRFKLVPLGKKYGTIQVFHNDLFMEVTTFRREGGYSDGRRPDWVEFSSNLEEDLLRRDFTVNAMALDPLDRVLVDPFGGKKDLRRGIIRAVGVPGRRFAEDALRMLRFFRFQATLGFRGDRSTENAINPTLLGRISYERSRGELTKTLTANHAQAGMEGLKRTGILGYLAPELIPVMQDEKIFSHLSKTVNEIKPLPHLRWAAFLHDIGKPECMTMDRHGLHYYGHEEVGREIAEGIMERFRFSREFIRKVSALVRWHMFSADPRMSDAALRRLAMRVGEENLRDLLELRRADIIATGRHYYRAWESFSAFTSRVEAFLTQEKVLSLKDLAVNGDDVMKLLRVCPGPQVGKALQDLFFWVTEDPTRNNKEDLFQYIKEHYARSE